MANLMLGWKNQVTLAALSASSAASGLGPANLQNDQGNAAFAWQTVGTSATLRIDTGADASAWRAFLLARTNLTTAATVRWRVGTAEALVEATPALAASFTAAIPAGWTYSRNGTASLAGAGGLLTACAPNQPRIEARGLLMEGAATNLFTWNDSATNAQYCGTNNTLSANGGPNYAGAVTTQCTFNGPDTNIFNAAQSVALAAGSYYTASWWVWIPGGATLTALTMAWEGNATNGSSVNANLALRDQFQLVSCTAQINAANSAAVMRIGGAPAGTVIYVCSKQIEQGRMATSYIHTTGGAAASRGADTLSTAAGVAAACAGGSYTMAALAYWNQAPPASQMDVTLSKAGSPSATARFGTQAQGLAFNGSGVQAGALSSAYAASSSRIVVAVSPGAFGFQAYAGAGQSLAGLPTAQLPDTLAVGSGVSMFLNNVALYGSRLSAAQMQALANTGSTMTNALAFDTGTVPAGVVAGFGQSVAIAPADVAGRVAVLDVADPANPDGFLNIPLAYAGPVLQPLRNYDFSSAQGLTDQTTKKASRAGGVTKRNDWVKRVFELSLSGIRSSEVAQFMALDRFGRQGGNVLLVPDPASATRAQEALFGEFEPGGNLGYPFQTAEARSYRATITERL